ncbi:hypothetical protein MKEN_01376600 [Mycena kentingensis (nom. inval.)]|nr:hypothetical protein MKEN_01376600 [Mycena kentingensis (nom. inval.)]
MSVQTPTSSTAAIQRGIMVWLEDQKGNIVPLWDIVWQQDDNLVDKVTKETRRVPGSILLAFWRLETALTEADITHLEDNWDKVEGCSAFGSAQNDPHAPQPDFIFQFNLDPVQSARSSEWKGPSSDFDSDFDDENYGERSTPASSVARNWDIVVSRRSASGVTESEHASVQSNTELGEPATLEENRDSLKRPRADIDDPESSSESGSSDSDESAAMIAEEAKLDMELKEIQQQMRRSRATVRTLKAEFKAQHEKKVAKKQGEIQCSRKKLHKSQMEEAELRKRVGASWIESRTVSSMHRDASRMNSYHFA